jgi:phage-related holin
MKTPSRWFWLGVLLSPAILLGGAAVAKRFPTLEYAMVVAVCLGVIAWLPFFMSRAKKEAAPAKKSDFIGYAAILAVLLLVAAIAYAVTR